MHRYRILDTPAEVEFDDIARIAADVCETPIALVNFVAGDRQWFKAEIGFGMRETPLDTSFCRHALLERDMLVVPDTTKDPRFECNPLVTDEPHLRFYAGALLKSEEGLPIGTVCVLDHRPRTLGDRQVRTLQALARQAMSQLRLRLALRQQLEIEARFRSMADNAPAMMWVTDANGYCLYLNRAWYDFTGQSEAQAEGFGWLDATHPDDRAEAERVFLAANARHESFRLEYRLRRADGTYSWAIDAARPRFGRAGDFRGHIGTVMDIDERRKSEERLRETERRLDAVLNNATVSIFLMDDRQQCVYMNAAAEKLTGYTLGDTRGRQLHDVTHHTYPDGRSFPIEDCAIDRAFPENSKMQGEDVFVHRDGHCHPVAFTASPIRDETSRTVGTIIEVRDISAEKAAEAALREAQRSAETLAAQQTAILGQLAEGVIFTDVAGRITFVNEAAERLHGVAHLDVAPDEYSKAYHLLTEDSRPYPAHELPLARAVRGETVPETRWRIRRPDGSDVLAIGSARPVLTADGTQMGAVLTLRDDTEREAAERRLRENEARLRALADNLPSGMVYQVTTGRDGSERRFVYVSQSHERLTGVPAQAVLADPTLPYQMILPEHRPVMAEAEAAAIRDRRPFDVEVEFRRADGQVRWCRIISAPRAQADGSLIWDGIQIDVTEQKQAEALLRELNERLEQRVTDALAERKLWADIFEATDALIAVIDPAYRFLALNKAYVDEFGSIYGVRPRVGDDILALLAGQSGQRAQTKAIWSRALSGEEFTVVGEFGDPDRKRSHYELSYSPLRDRDGRFIGAFQYARDVTERRRGEVRLAEAQEQLRQSQKMEVVGQLTGGVAHDFNNLLQIVTGNLDIIQRNLPEDAARLRRAAGNAMTGARRAASLTQRLLAFSRRQPLQPKPISVNRLVTDMSDLLGRTLGETIEIETILAGGLWQVEADPNQLEAAILNLAVNARDAMPEGGKLTIETSNAHLDHAYVAQNAEVAPGQYVVICVSDTGTGMDKETISKAFEPFFTTKEVGRGTGLGLSQVYGFVKQSGGNVKIYSEVGEGTTVKIYLPRLLGDAAEDEADIETAAPEGNRLETILVVEDDDDVRGYSVEVLRELGYRVLEAHDGPSAIRLIERQEGRIDLLFSDVVLPGGMTGAVVAREAKALLPDLKVLFTTGYARNAIVHQGRLDPGVQLITKPFTYADLAARVRDILDGQA